MGPNHGYLSPLADRQAKSGGRPTDACCALRGLIPKVTRCLYGRSNPTEAIFIPYFLVGALLPQSATASGHPTESTSFLVPHTVIRAGLPPMSGLFAKNPRSLRGKPHSQHS